MLVTDITVPQLLEHSAILYGRQTLAFARLGRTQSRSTFEDVFRQALGAAQWLQQHGYGPGRRVMVTMPTKPESVVAFFGALLAGCAVLPVSAYSGLQDREGFRYRMANAIRVGSPDLVVAEHWVVEGETVASVQPGLLAEQAPAMLRPLERPNPDDPALIQFTSGSTAAPKGVLLTQRNVVAGCLAIGRSVPQIDDRSLLWCSWLPLHHDMGLIGMLSFYIYGINQRLYSPRAFVGAPGRWLADFAEVGGNIYAGPSFSYRAMLDDVPDDVLAGLDLSGWRAAFNGAEPVSAEVVEAFIDRMGPQGFRSEAMLPVYGMAETTLAASFSSLDEPVRIHDTTHQGVARRLVSVGRAVDGHEIRVRCGERDAVEGEIGEIEVSGPGVMQGYAGDPEATAQVLRDGWLATGDLGLVHDGDLYVTGRVKDLIILHGRNIYPTDAEAIVEGIEGVHRRRVAAVADPSVERIHVAMESRLDPAAAQDLVARARARLVALLETDAIDVHVLPTGGIPRTTSGKVRRAALRQSLLGPTEPTHG